MVCPAPPLLAPDAVNLAPDAVAHSYYLWPQSMLRVPVRLIGGSEAMRARVRAAVVSGWNTASALQFTFTDGPAWVRVSLVPGASWSYVGTQALSIPEPQPTMQLGMNSWDGDEAVRRVTLHEFGHAAGLLHEHESPNAHIPWDLPAVYAYYEACGWDRAMVDAHVLGRVDEAVADAGTYDARSVMHYAIPPELVLDRVARGGATELSPGDRAFVSRLYGPPPGTAYLPIVRR